MKVVAKVRQQIGHDNGNKSETMQIGDNSAQNIVQMITINENFMII